MWAIPLFCIFRASNQVVSRANPGSWRWLGWFCRLPWARRQRLCPCVVLRVLPIPLLPFRVRVLLLLFFFLGSHLSPQAPSHQYQSPPALRPLHSRPLGRRRLGWLWLPRFCLRFHRPFLSTHQPHSDEVISLWIFQPSKSRNMGCSGSSKSRSSISSAVSARSSFPWDPCCTSSARAAAWPWCSCRRRWVKSLLDMASGQRLGLITPRVSHYRVPSQRTPPRGRCKCTFFTPTWARRTWANSHSWRNLNDRENFKNDLMGVQWCPVHFSQPQYPFIDD